jgi:hypothetical protein
MAWMEPPREWKIFAVASAESIVPLYVAFSCLMIAWLCVAVGMRRQTEDSRLRD